MLWPMLVKMERGFDALKVVWQKMVVGYLNRCEVAGFDRRSRITVPLDPPF
jgi:hypothetical protein